MFPKHRKWNKELSTPVDWIKDLFPNSKKVAKYKDTRRMQKYFEFYNQDKQADPNSKVYNKSYFLNEFGKSTNVFLFFLVTIKKFGFAYYCCY